MSLTQRAFARCCTARALRRRPRPPSCAVGLRWGDFGANDCPPDYFRIITIQSCQAVARLAPGLTFDTYSNDPSTPKGCWGYASAYGQSLIFNAHPVGAGVRSYRLLCLGAPASVHRRPKGGLGPRMFPAARVRSVCPCGRGARSVLTGSSLCECARFVLCVCARACGGLNVPWYVHVRARVCLRLRRLYDCVRLCVSVCVFVRVRVRVRVRSCVCACVCVYVTHTSGADM
jgi:hypothetical protein